MTTTKLLIVLLVATIFLNTSALNHGALKGSNPKSPLSSVTTMQRFLKIEPTNNTGDEEDGERAGAQGVVKLVDLDAKTGKFENFNNWLVSKYWTATGADPWNVFRVLRLGKAKDRIGEKKNIIWWFRFVQDYRTRKGLSSFRDYQMFSILNKSGASEAKLALLFQSLKDIEDVRPLATSMQTFQFQYWKNRQRYTPDTVRNILLSNHNALDAASDSRYKIISSFEKSFNSL
ncbi:RxLR effector protein [Phytophthora megakarya]|uniref:RxLR effector protein n=1 Tax=Phytophthora megakarya TaxID=4795 RepID=A0A225W522_9STRA|nr:RxLR effector protein [Phytophthora megakarya]